MVKAAVEIKIDAVVKHPLAPHALAHAELGQEIGEPLLQQPGADPMLDVMTAAGLEHDGIDSRAAQQQRQHEPGRTRADDPDLRAHRSAPFFVMWRPTRPHAGDPRKGR